MPMLSYDDELISIITPAFRVENVIMETINSVIQQSYINWELLIADDCSPDCTAAVVLTAAEKDPRIHLISCQRNGGPAAARNAAIDRAKGRWVAFLDSDDTWLPTKLEETVSFARKENAALAFTAFRRTSADGITVGRHVGVPNKISYKQLLGNTTIATSTVLVDRSLVGEFRMPDAYYDDFVCWLSILKRGFLARGLNKDLMRYRVLPSSVSRNKLKSAGQVWKTYRKIENLGFTTSAFHFIGYCARSILKYRKL
jgi:teichuronic acid biosynthesis glycosyltransferase TuaG